jgi:hypothetical protein
LLLPAEKRKAIVARLRLRGRRERSLNGDNAGAVDRGQ